jgi:hypothetical protein
MRSAIALSDSAGTWFRGANHIRGQARIAAIRVNDDKVFRLSAHPTAKELKEKLDWFADNRPLLFELAKVKGATAEDEHRATALRQPDPPIVIPTEPDHRLFDDPCSNDPFSHDSNNGTQILDFESWI